jgi:hypothetical protein
MQYPLDAAPAADLGRRSLLKSAGILTSLTSKAPTRIAAAAGPQSQSATRPGGRLDQQAHLGPALTHTSSASTTNNWILFHPINEPAKED